MKWNHNQLAHDLAEHLRKNTARIVWEDMQLGPSGTARPDVYALPCSFSKFCPVVYEIKVSVSDFRADVTAGKFTKYFKYASAVVFAVPDGMLKKSEIPDGCGLMIRKESGWHTLKGPTMRPIDNIPRDAWIKLVIDGIKRETERTRLSVRSASTYSTERDLVKRHGGDIASLVSQAYSAKERLEDAIRQQEKRRAEVFKQTAEEARLQRESIERDAGRLNDAQIELAVTLGLPANATIHQLTRAISQACYRLSGDSEIQRLRRIFGSLERMLSDANERLPGEISGRVPHD
ncbi:MmcB family DNA repair protein [Pectobacterium brasiliense]|uniref:MmcB family DNA repair protein n=1 Tax=Pectobacterium brasiliense TaxID=180957 RepID=A0AAW9HIX3_9GAMM|nr:MmcB family DNA repair protein [Pectobacterium brasiliense]MDY4380369.1 MmcB family DNA repair protein [Pectobacterium brasiliense]